MNELVLLESATLRRDLCTEDNALFLDRVGQLITLPETGWTVTREVAKFYQVSIKTMETTVRRNRDELEEDGYKCISAKEFRDLHNEGLKSKARKIAVFPRRAVLRIGMLLRDSPVAQKVRTYLLNREFEARHLSPDLSPLLINQVRMFSPLLAGQEVLAGRLDKLERWVRKK